jgi:iron(III) transport system permease protein
MRLPTWATGLAWLLFTVVALLPLAQLGHSVLWVDGRFDPSPMGELLLTGDQWALLGNSLLVAGGASALALTLGLPFATLIAKTDLWGRRFFGLAYLLPLLIPPYMHAIVWGRLLAADGPVNGFLVDLLGLPGPPLAVHSVAGTVLVLGLAYYPFVTLLAWSGLKSIDPRLEEAALMHHGPLRTLARVTLPLVSPHVLAGTVFVFVFSVINFGVPDILRVKVYPIEIFIQFSAFYDARGAVVLGLPLLLVTLALVTVQVLTMRGRSYVSYAGEHAVAHRYRLGRAQLPALAFCLAVLGLSVAVPVAALAARAGSMDTLAQGIDTSLGQIGYSFLVAAGAAAVMTVLAFVLAHSMVRSGGKTRLLLEYLTQIPFAVPPIMLGLGLIGLWNRPQTDWLYASHLIIVLAYLAHFIPFTVRAVYSSLQQADRRLEEMGWLLSGNRLRVTWRIVLPLIRNGLATGFFISFVLAMAELGVTLLVIPPGTETIPIKIYNFMHYGAEGMVAALCIILLALQLGFSLGVLGLARWRRVAAA